MILDEQTKEQLNEYLMLIENPIKIKLSVNNDDVSKEMEDLIIELSSIANNLPISPKEDKITFVKTNLERTPSFTLGENITFAGIPLGHEFSSLVLAILQTSGRKPKIEESLINAIKSIDKELNFTTYISLSCHNCPDVVQALNTMSILNPRIKHTMVDGGVFSDEVSSKNILAVPYVELNGEYFLSGRASIEEILKKLGFKEEAKVSNEPYDVLIVGGGPSGSSAAIYSARKGIKTGIISGRFGGQVLDTLGIENLIGTKYTEGPELVKQLEQHVREYNVDIINNQMVKSVTKSHHFNVILENGQILHSKTLILSTGARWRNLGVPGENEFKNKGVAYCPHCDGPLFKGKHVAVIGGGNSGVEAAIDLAGIVSHVTLIEFGENLKADQVLQNRLHSLTNTTVITNAQTKEIKGEEKVKSLVYLDRLSNIEKSIELDGVFIQIGLLPNTDFVKDLIELNKFGEIIVDKSGKTNVEGLFASGDCTDSPFKQIIISMGSGATSALSAFDFLMRH